jgi:N-acetylneuraminate synthase
MKIGIIAEIGLNHNGDINIAKQLIDLAALAGCDYVKFQKRNPDKCIPEDQKWKMRQTQWGEMTYLEYKHKMEFNTVQYAELVSYAHNKGLSIFSSAWDKDSVDFLSMFGTRTSGTIPLYNHSCGFVVKIPSALITDIELIKYARKKSDILMISTGMSTEEQIELAVAEGDPDIIFHTNSTYPCPVEELNLEYIKWLKQKYPNKKIGYSGHEFGIVTTFAAVACGAEIIERHITLDRTMIGSDHSSSVEPTGVFKLVKGIRDIEKAMNGYGSRGVLKGELEKMKTLKK